MNTELPSEKLKRAWSWKQWTIAGATAAVLVAAGTTAAVAGPGLLPQPSPTPTVAFVESAQTGRVNAAPQVSAEQQQEADQQEAQLEADNAAKAKAAADAAAQAAAEQAAKDASAKKTAQSKTVNVGKHPAGTPLPFIKSDDPQNGLGGDYIDPGLFCANGSASTINGVPTCD